MTHTEEILALIDALETTHTELLLTGHPLAEQVEDALARGELDTLRRARTAVLALKIE